MNLDLSKHVMAAGAGELIEMYGPTAGSITILVDPVNTGKTNLCTLIQKLNPGAAVPVHKHDQAEQVLYFLSGCCTVSISRQKIEVKPGTTVHVPKGVDHGIVNTGKTASSFLEVTTPPGFQEAFRSMSKLSDPTPQAIAKIARQHDILISDS
jgi:quercetin dioxygenase-like cupin family protein